MVEGYEHAKLIKEVTFMQQLAHPYIIKFIEYFESEKEFFIVMEYIPGRDLFDEVTHSPRLFTEGEVAPIFAQVVCAICHLHNREVMHRDIKPENVYVIAGDYYARNPDKAIEGPLGVPRMKLLDFGESKLINSSSAKSFAGTPKYMAPEVEETRGGARIPYTKAADVWSLGILLYVTLSREFPNFSGDVFRKPIFRPEKWTGRSAEVVTLIENLISWNPNNRMPIQMIFQHPWLSNNNLGLTYEQASQL